VTGGQHAIASTRPPDPDATAVVCTHLSKTFGGQVALRDVTVKVAAGETHALVGQNGAGKSTLIGVLSGRLSPDEGAVFVSGSSLRLGDPRASRASGIACIYQHLTILPNLTATENVFLGQPLSARGRVSRSAMEHRFVELCNGLGLTIAPRARAGLLSIAEQQVLEILRGLQAGARVLLLDEPTAALPVTESDRLYSIVASLRDAGTTCILVSHKLDEVLKHSQSIPVMRNGAVVETRTAPRWSEDDLIAAMDGGASPRRARSAARAGPTHGTHGPLMELTDLKVPGALDVPELHVHRGEMLGVAGLVGSGRSTLLHALAGMVATSSGHLSIDGLPVRWPTTPRRSLRSGIALLPEDRKSAIVMNLPIWDNVGLGYGAQDAPRWFLSRRSRAAYATRHLAGLDFDVNRLAEPISNLSGGNQQKVLIAKWAGRNVTLLLADEPTQAVDVTAKAEVLARLRRIADNAKGVILVSSELEEIIDVCDRAVVLWRGRVVGELSRTSPEWHPSTLLRMAFGKADQGEETHV
jgi:ABC-type sugar transport system ATPase subunit